MTAVSRHSLAAQWASLSGILFARADSAYPEQTGGGIETVSVGGDQLAAVAAVLEAVDAAKHVYAVLLVDAELAAVAEADAPGVTAYHQRLDTLLAGRPVDKRPHEAIIRDLDEAGTLFRVLGLKTDMTVPSTSFFLRLECGYWSPEKEARRRSRSGSSTSPPTWAPTGRPTSRAAGTRWPARAAGYFNECMSGFEYQAAGHMLWEGLLLEGLAVTRAVHDRYHAAARNPSNEAECSDHYVRAMAGYGVFQAACGFTRPGPARSKPAMPGTVCRNVEIAVFRIVTPCGMVFVMAAEVATSPASDRTRGNS